MSKIDKAAAQVFAALTERIAENFEEVMKAHNELAARVEELEGRINWHAATLESNNEAWEKNIDVLNDITNRLNSKSS